MVVFILGTIIILNVLFLIYFLKDVIKHKAEMMQESASPLGVSIATAIIFFLSTFGISDFAISTVLYHKLKWVSDKNLPGTLNTQFAIPVAATALAFITSIQVDITTLLVCIGAQIVGAYIGPRVVVKLSERTIQTFIGIGLLIATVVIVAGKLGVIPAGGDAYGLTGWKLVVAALALFAFGALNNIGIGSYAPTMVVVYALGMHPIAAFPIMMGACSCSVPIASMEFVKYGAYSRKITLFSIIPSVIGVLLAVYVVKSLDIKMLQWVVAAVLLYTSITMLQKVMQKKTKIELK